MDSRDARYTFSEVLDKTGLSRAEAIVACHRIGKNIFGTEPEKIEFTETDIELLTIDAQRGSPKAGTGQAKKTAHKSKNRPRPAKNVDDTWSSIAHKSPLAIADYMGASLEQVLDACAAVGVEVKDPGSSLPRKSADAVRNNLALRTLDHGTNPAEPSGLGVDIKRLIHDAKTTPPKPPRAPVIARATTKRIEVLARELGEPVDRVLLVMELMQIPRIGGDKEKLATRHEAEVRMAIGLFDDLPSDRMDRGQVRIRPMAESRGVTLEVAQELCRSIGIELSHGKYATVRDALVLALKLADPDVLSTLRGAPYPSADASASSTEDHVPGARVDYRGIDLSRQNFSGYSFDGAVMAAVNLGFCNLVGSSLCGADLTGADLTRAICTDARFDTATCDGASFSRAVLDGADFSGASLRGADFTGCSLVGTSFAGADLTDATIDLDSDVSTLSGPRSPTDDITSDGHHIEGSGR